MATSGSKTAVVSAIFGNSFVMIVKFAAFFFTGSGAMLSEAIHTLADLLNQILLYVGIVRSAKSPDPSFEYGYGAEKFVWALMSAVGIFFLGCGVTVYHGISTFFNPGEIVDLKWAIAVLIISFFIEGYVFVVAFKELKKAAGRKGFFKFIKTEADPSTLAVLFEDFAACIGVALALIGIILVKVTGNHYWDGIFSILIGLLLGFVAIALIIRNKDLLIGKSIPYHTKKKIVQVIMEHPAVEEIIDLKTQIVDTDTYRVKADIHFDGVKLAEKLEPKIKEAYPNVTSYEEFHDYSLNFAEEVIELLADEIDVIETKIRKTVPKAQFLDLEAD